MTNEEKAVRAARRFLRVAKIVEKCAKTREDWRSPTETSILEAARAVLKLVAGELETALSEMRKP